MATTGTSHSSITTARPRRRRGPLALVAGPPEAVEHLAVEVVGHLVLEGHPAVADPVVEGVPVVKGLSRPAEALGVQLHLEASIVQMKTTMSGSASPIASDPPLKFRAQPDLRVSASFSRHIASAPVASGRLARRVLRLNALPHRYWRRNMPNVNARLSLVIAYFSRPSGLSQFFPDISIWRPAMRIRARADNPAAVLCRRLEALASQLAELESLRDRVDREENRQRELGYPRKAGALREQVSGRCNFTDAKLVSAPPGRNTSNYSNECSKANG